MNDKQLKAALVIVLANATLIGCGAHIVNQNTVDEFKPESEDLTTTYGAVEGFGDYEEYTEENTEEFEPEIEDSNEVEEDTSGIDEILDGTSEDDMTVSNEKSKQEEVVNHSNNEANIEDEYLLSDEEKDKLLEDDFEVSMDDMMITLMYGPKPIKEDGE